MAKILTKHERFFVYNKLMDELDKLGLQDSPIEGIRKLKVMAKLWLDTAMEFNGEIELPNNNRITYQFWKDHRQQTNVYISRGAAGLKNYKKEDNDYDIIENKVENKVENKSYDDDDKVPNLISV
jgi:hypothetical protein